MIFMKYFEKDQQTISRVLFEKNLLEKRKKNDFVNDMNLLLPVGNNWNFEEGFNLVWKQLVSRIPW